ncbi:MAG: hypothetical protein U0670_23305 [Anaerolineae bacterium]
MKSVDDYPESRGDIIQPDRLAEFASAAPSKTGMNIQHDAQSFRHG